MKRAAKLAARIEFACTGHASQANLAYARGQWTSISELLAVGAQHAAPLQRKTSPYRGLFMPVVGSSAYNTAGQITSLVRSLLNDAQGNLFTDAVLLPYANSAYRKVQRSLGNAGGGGFIQDDVLLVVPAVSQTDTSLQVAITDATASPNQLPTDLLVPVMIWERAQGSR